LGQGSATMSNIINGIRARIVRNFIAAGITQAHNQSSRSNPTIGISYQEIGR